MKYNDNKYRWSPEEITRRMNNNAQKCVKNEFSEQIVLSRADIYNIFICMRRINRWELRKIKTTLSFAWKLAQFDDNKHAVIAITEDYQGIIMNALIEGSNTRDMFDTLQHFMRWFGLSRVKLQKTEYFIPQDNRPGIYDNDEYDGTQYYEFVDQTFENPEESIEAQEEKYLKEQMEYA